MAASTRPLTLGEILDRTVQLYRRNFALFLGISILPSAVYVLVTGVAGIYFSNNNPVLQNPKAGPEAFVMLGLFGIVFCLVGLPILLALSAISGTILNAAALAVQRGESTTVRASFRYGFQYFWRYLGVLCLQLLFAAVIPSTAGTGIIIVGSILATLIAGTGGGVGLATLMGLLMFVLILALIVACVLIWLRLSLAFPVCGAEQQSPWLSIKRSNLLSKGTRGRVFVLYLLVTILAVVVYYMLTLPVDIVLKLTLYKSVQTAAIFTRPPLALQIVNLVVSCLERAFVLPIYAIALVLFYVDQRTRLEGYDIEQLMAGAGWSNLPAPPSFSGPSVASYPVTSYPATSYPATSYPVTSYPVPAPKDEAALQDPLQHEPTAVNEMAEAHPMIEEFSSQGSIQTHRSEVEEATSTEGVREHGDQHGDQA
jgi:hypothetical protein